MKKTVMVLLVGVFLLSMTGVALAVDPTVIDETSPAEGRSAWTYKDLQDATAKYEGGYAQFDDTTGAVGLYAGGLETPHGGYNTTTNKCKVCHAVHRAEGAYYLMRADSQDDACSYCHTGASAHSSKVVYDLNPDGIYTMNGHTIGAQSVIPDSTIKQEAILVPLQYVDADGVTRDDEIMVRSYVDAKAGMYRFVRHHGQAATTYVDATPLVSTFTQAARGGYQKIGPLALRCMNCHQPHNAINEVWRPRVFNPGVTGWSATKTSPDYYSNLVDGPFSATGYKLLRRSPSGTTYGSPNFTSATDPTEYWGSNQVVKAIEDSATAGVNFSQDVSSETTYTENAVTRSMPVWIAQDIHGSGTGDTGIYRYPNKVNTAALSWWCGDCHNLNIGGWEPIKAELGFKAHTERTHPAPFYGAYTGPGQCYSCHRNDLPVQMGTSTGAAGGTAPAALYAGRESCTQCHFGTGDYYQSRMTATPVESDFPHSGAATDIKLLGSYSVSNTSTTGGWLPQYDDATITDTTLDQVCLRCHPGVGINH